MKKLFIAILLSSLSIAFAKESVDTSVVKEDASSTAKDTSKAVKETAAEKKARIAEEKKALAEKKAQEKAKATEAKEAAAKAKKEEAAKAKESKETTAQAKKDEATKAKESKSSSLKEKKEDLSKTKETKETVTPVELPSPKKEPVPVKESELTKPTKPAPKKTVNNTGSPAADGAAARAKIGELKPGPNDVDKNGKQLTSQQMKMKECSSMGKGRNQADFRAFMSECLKSE